MAKKAAAAAKTARQPKKAEILGTCEVWSTHQLICPLCHHDIPAKTQHTCHVYKQS